MDFYQISIKELKDGTMRLYPDWTVGRFKDLMVRGRSFYAIWDEAAGMWSTDEYDVPRLVDEDLQRYANENQGNFQVLNLKSFNTNVWTTFKKFIYNISDNSHPLDQNLTFANTEVKKTDYVSKRLPYSLESGRTDAWDELLGVLYSDEERAKIEWAIGSIVAGESKKIQKFLVFYGPAGSGKSTVLNIIQKLFSGYTTSFDAKALGNSNNSFSTEVFKSNPLVAIQHDGDLSKIDDNTKLNSIISHEEMTMNEKFKSTYTAKVNAFLFMGTNQPVKISDAKSGIIRRLIDVRPTGVKIEAERYHILLQQIDFELGAIAHKCLERYREMGKHYYTYYRPLEMMLQTDVFYNFIESIYDILKSQNGISLKQAYELYKEYCAESGVDRLLPKYKFREELRNYFNEFYDKIDIDGVLVRSYYFGFKDLTPPSPFVPDDGYIVEVEDGNESVFDRMYSDQPAQYARQSGNPGKKWDQVDTILDDLTTSRLHFVKVPENHIVVDFDLVDESGEKSIELNIVAASKFPPTYTEVSKSGQGLHLHYIYNGDVNDLASVYDIGIEVKTLLGDSSLRRKLTKCNSLEVSTISGGLPKKEKRMLDNQSIQSEKGLRDLIERNLRKEIHPGTKPSVDFIHKILEDAYNSDLAYDLTDMRGRILTFAAKSTNQAPAAVKVVQQMKFVSKHGMREITDPNEKAIAFFDVEVYPNLFVVCWKYEGSDTVVRMINPSANEIEAIFALKLIGFNNRRYDNHILYARFLGYSLIELFDLSQKIIDNRTSVLFGEAYNLSYADIYDFSSKKQGLKKFQIELGIHHMELDLPWDNPVPEEKWDKVVEYCANDVLATEAVFKSRAQDFVARKILSELSGLSINHTTQNHTAKIIFGDEKNPQKNFVYTDLSKEFRGYKFDGKESTYRGEITGEGGYVYAEPGMYENVTVLDVASMHPTSIEQLNLFGQYTSNFSALKEARMAIKHKDYGAAKDLLNGKLEKFLGNVDDAEALAYALKLVINIVYGLTSARFSNPFRDNRNKDNIVAKRGALFMIDLKNEVQKKGFTVAHIKTDSIKIPNATPEIIDFIIEFGNKYGYDFEYEAMYEKFCLVNDAVYVARVGDKWTAVGAQFQHPYVFKRLFTYEPLVFDDFCETKNVVQGSMYLEFDVAESLEDMIHVGRTGSFVPVTYNGGTLWRIKDGKKYAVTGTKGRKWVEREIAIDKKKTDELYIDMEYFDKLRDDAFDAIDFFGPFNKFVE
jgi:energy-coupling factor transporter ATP-binding protein EcfA2